MVDGRMAREARTKASVDRAAVGAEMRVLGSGKLLEAYARECSWREDNRRVACTNEAESFFSRLRRSEMGIHHRIAFGAGRGFGFMPIIARIVASVRFAASSSL